jgi:transposase
MDHIGIDVQKKESQICILSEDGERLEPRVRTTPARFTDVLGTRPRARILLEASTESEWVARCLEWLGHEVIVADPNFRPDVRDPDAEDQDRSARRAGAGRGLPAGGVPPGASAVRRPAACPGSTHRPRRFGAHPTGYIAVLRALLRQHGWRVPTGSAEGFIRRVLALALPGRLLSEVAPLLAVMRSVNQQLAYSDERIAAVARADERVQRLQTVPSVGPVTAAAFVATIDDAQRFRRPHEVGAARTTARAGAHAAAATVSRRRGAGVGARRGQGLKARDGGRSRAADRRCPW